MSPALSLPSPFDSPIASPLVLTHHHQSPTSPPQALFDGLDIEHLEVKLANTDEEMDLELGMSLGLDVDLRKSSSEISPAFDPRNDESGWGESNIMKRKPSLPPPLMPIKKELLDPEYSISKKGKDGKKDKSDKLDKSDKSDKDKKKKPTLPKKEEDEKDLLKRKKEKEGKEKTIKEEKAEKEKEKEEKEEDRDEDDKGDLEPSLKRAKRFCMDSKVRQKWYQSHILTIYSGSKALPTYSLVR